MTTTVEVVHAESDSDLSDREESSEGTPARAPPTPASKKCGGCKKDKPLSDFDNDKRRMNFPEGPDKKRTRCKECENPAKKQKQTVVEEDSQVSVRDGDAVTPHSQNQSEPAATTTVGSGAVGDSLEAATCQGAEKINQLSRKAAKSIEDILKDGRRNEKKVEEELGDNEEQYEADLLKLNRKKAKREADYKSKKATLEEKLGTIRDANSKLVAELKKKLEDVFNGKMLD